MSEELKYINADLIHTNKENLRGVQSKDDQFIELCNSIKTEGLLQPIQVAPRQDSQTGENYYVLVDGTQRLAACKAAGIVEIPCYVRDATELEVLERQIISNAVRVETKPVQYSKHLRSILNLNPTTTVSQLAARLSKSEAWLKGRLTLTDLNPDVARLVDDGTINVSSAVALATLPPDVQQEYLQAASTMPHSEFTPIVQARKKELDKARREGREASSKVFEPTAYFQKIGDVKTELETQSIGNMLIGKGGFRTAEEGWKAAIEWVLHLDPASVAEARQKHEEIAKATQDKKDAAKLEREKKKLERDQLKAERSKLMIETMEAGGNVAEVLAEFDKKHGLDN